MKCLYAFDNLTDMIKSKALEINLANYHVDVTIDLKYAVLQRIMSSYYGIMEGLNTFLKELSHPFRNWNFIISEARAYSLEYFHLLVRHPDGPEAAGLYIDIFMDAIAETREVIVKIDAIDNLLLFMQKIIKDSGEQLPQFIPTINYTCDRVRNQPDEIFLQFVRSYYQIKKLGELLYQREDFGAGGLDPVNRLLIRYFERSYAYWLSERDPLEWFAEDAFEIDRANHYCEISDFFKDITHAHLQQLNHRLENVTGKASYDARQRLAALLELPGYGQQVETYRQIPQQLLKAGESSGSGNQWKVIFLFHVLNISGLASIHEEALRDINRTVGWLIDHESDTNIRRLIQKTFSILKNQTFHDPSTALNCVLNMGKGVYKTDERDLVKYFVDHVIDLEFQVPMISGVGNDWQILANGAHIQNVRTWLELIELNPKWSPRLLSALIIHVALCGIFIKDTDLFPRDITRLLNSDIGPVYNLVKQLTRLFPVYFNDIGAEGKLRDISTEIDEITHRKDVLVHFLRKQSHVESSNQILEFMEATIRYWESGNKSHVEPFVPPNIYARIKTDGLYLDGLQRALQHLRSGGISIPGGLLKISERELSRLLGEMSELSDIDLKRVQLAVTFYKLLRQKYTVGFTELDSYLAQLSTEAFPDLSRLKSALREPDTKKKLFLLLEYLSQLQNWISSDEKFEVREDIYKKRHITVDIPSMYGSYHEPKFDALGLTFRIEALVNVLFEELISSMDLSLITKATFYQIYARIRLFDKALKLDGIVSVEIERQLDLLARSLEVQGFTFTQYLDIFKGFATAVKNIINDYFHNIHEQNLDRILYQVTTGRILNRYMPSAGQETTDQEKLKLRVSEIFFRDRIALSLGLQQFDRFVSRILTTLFQQADKLPKDKLHQLLIYDPENTMTSLNQPDNRVTGLIYMGNKGLNLIKLKQLGMPVPPGFIITTEVFRCRAMIDQYRPAEKNLKEQIARHITRLEDISGKIFGDPGNPLLFSVRSGSSISQPGMMDTFLNVGMNEEIAAGLAAQTGNAWFAWDNYRRFLQCYGMGSELERDDFDAIINELKRRAGIAYKRDFTGKQMRKVAMTYKAMVREAGIRVPDDPFDQLYQTILSVLNSWESSKARTYRKIMGISDDWGTAVTVQSMVYGNLSENAGSGVIFTHSPRWAGDSMGLWGDFTRGNQGEDVVSGLVLTQPISIRQQDVEMRPTDITLESHYPEIYQALETWTNMLIYEKGWGPQEIEFTFEGPSAKELHILQCRDMAMRERKNTKTFDLLNITEDKYLGHGIGIGGGAMSGRLVFTLKEIDYWREKEPDTHLILARSDTVPDDIREIYAADGLLTARGGVTSHASVVAHRLGKTCVVGCRDMVCDEAQKICTLQQISIESGDLISIDGREGSIYNGRLRINEV